MLQSDAVEDELPEEAQPRPIDALQAPQVERSAPLTLARLPQLIHPGASEASFEPKGGPVSGLNHGDPKHVRDPEQSPSRLGSPCPTPKDRPFFG